jgi:3-hydroxyisobutyrate dehydrogenase-like beta-hydroxyacid dehydrogenase
MNYPALAFIGFGEAGQALAAGWRFEGVASIAAWDILFPDAQGGTRLRAAAERLGVRMGRDAPDAVRGADIVFSAVTAASNLEAARQAAAGLSPRQFYVELNSVSPNRKREAGAIVGDRARFVGMAVMAPVHPLRHKTPVLISGPAAKDLLLLLRRCGMDVEEVGADVGAAAAIKMVRSVMIKGLGALTQECFLAARRAGVEDRIIASLTQSFPMIDWAKFADYNLERMATHGLRRAAEMRDVCETLESLGVEPALTRGTVIREQRTGEARLRDRFGGKVPEDRGAVLDALIGQGRDPLV